jgi:hypothetical protein
MECNRRLAELREAVATFLSQSAPDYVYWVERSGKAQKNLSLNAAPIDVADYLRHRLFGSDTSVVMTSATLATNGGQASACPASASARALELRRPTPSPAQRGRRDACPTLHDVRSSSTDREMRPALAALAAGRVHLFRYVPTGRLDSSGEAQAVENELEAWLAEHPEPHSTEVRREYYERFTERFHQWLDAGHGACWLKDPARSAIVEQSLKHFDGQRYLLGDYVVMPNHVHVLVRPVEGHFGGHSALMEILHRAQTERSPWPEGKGLAGRVIRLHRAKRRTVGEIWRLHP